VPLARSPDGTRLHWRADGTPGAPPLLLLNSIGTDLSLWDAVVPLLAPFHRVIRMDTRGHGASDAPDADYTLDQLATDALSVLDAAGVARASIAGVSLGGMVAQRLAASSPTRIDRLVLICTTRTIARAPWDDRIRIVRSEGPDAIADLVMERFFSARFRVTGAPILASVRASLSLLDRAGYAGCAAAIRDLDPSTLDPIAAPTLVIGGADDVSMPPVDHAAPLAAAIPGSRLAILPSGHLPPYETPTSLARAILTFLDPTTPDREAVRAGAFEAGLAPRRAVLGSDWVDRSLANRTPLTHDFQDLITRYAWGEIWTRPGLDHRTRRLLVLAITASMGRWEEFALHVRAGLTQGGFTLADLEEVLLQTAIYAGVPAANTGFREAQAVLKDLAQAPQPNP